MNGLHQNGTIMGRADQYMFKTYGRFPITFVKGLCTEFLILLVKCIYFFIIFIWHIYVLYSIITNIINLV